MNAGILPVRTSNPVLNVIERERIAADSDSFGFPGPAREQTRLGINVLCRRDWICGKHGTHHCSVIQVDLKRILPRLTECLEVRFAQAVYLAGEVNHISAGEPAIIHARGPSTIQANMLREQCRTRVVVYAAGLPFVNASHQGKALAFGANRDSAGLKPIKGRLGPAVTNKRRLIW